jgi:hypothetical protein
MFDIRSSEFSNCWSSESSRPRSLTTSGRLNPAGHGIRPPVDQIPAGILLDSGQSGQNGQDPAGYDRIRPLIQPDPVKISRRMLPDSGDICETLIFAFLNFFVRTKHRKIFSRKSFFLKMISSKSFYVETNGASVLVCWRYEIFGA